MQATWAHYSLFTARKLLLCSALGFVGLLVGVACVVAPPAVPFGIIGVAALILLWTMPDLRLVPQGFMRFAFLPFQFTYICVPAYYAIIIPGVPYISIRRAFLFAFVIPLVITISGSAEARRRIGRILRSAPAVRFFLIATCFWMLVASAFARTVPNGLIINAIYQLMPLLGVALIIVSMNQIRRYFLLAFICLFFNCIIGAVESYLRHPFLIYLLPAYMREQIFAQNPLAERMLVLGAGIRNGQYRATSTLSNPLTWGEASAMLAPMCTYFLLHGKSRLERSVGVIGIAIAFASIYLSGSRGAFVGIITSMGCYLGVWALRTCLRHPERIGGLIWITIYGMLGSMTVAAILFVGRIHRMVLGGGEAQASTDARWDQWALAQPKLLASPLWGYGIGSANEVVGYRPASDAPLTIDSYVINLLIDLGIPGFIFFTGLFFSATYVCFRNYIVLQQPLSKMSGSIGASLLAFIIYRITLSQGESLTVAFVLIGFALAINHLLAPELREWSEKRRRRLMGLNLPASL